MPLLSLGPTTMTLA